MRKGAFVLAVWILSGCGGGAAPASSAAVTTAATATSSPAPSPSASTEPWPSGGPVPTELSGVWRLGTSAGTMRLSGNTYAFGQSNGNVVVNGNEIAFFNGSGCGLALPGGIGRYSWTLSGTEVSFVALSPDPCGRSDLLAGVTWSTH
jgi:hypothetical protein